MQCTYQWRLIRVLGMTGMFELKTFFLFLVTAIAEMAGCYLPYLWLKQGQSAWLLTLHPTAAGRTYAAYGGVYIFVAVLWLWSVEGVRPTAWDIAGSLVALAGMAIIMFGPKHT